MSSKRIWKDIDIGFYSHPVTRDITKKTGDAAIIQSVYVLLSAGKYERLFQPDLYSNLKASLFEPLDGITAGVIKREIERVVTNHEPRVKLEEVNCIPDYDNNGYSINLTFFIINSPNPVSIQFFLERIR